MNLFLLLKMDIPFVDHSLEGLYKEEDSSDSRELSTFQHGLQWKHCLSPRGKEKNTENENTILLQIIIHAPLKLHPNQCLKNLTSIMMGFEQTRIKPWCTKKKKKGTYKIITANSHKKTEYYLI